MKNIILYILFIWSLIGLNSCKKLDQADPPTNQLVSSNVYSSNATASAVINGIFLNMNSYATGFDPYFGVIAGLSADELKYYGNNVAESQYYANSLQSNLNSSGIKFWSEIYQRYIYPCNDLLSNLPNDNVSPAVSTQLIGEAKFLRAFYYFYLVNQWGDVPLLTTTNYKSNGSLGRSSVADVYALIRQDLLDAQKLLNDNYLKPDAVTPSSERTIPNKAAATALLARVDLYLGDLNHDAASYVDAEKQSSILISNTSVYNLQTNLNSVFLANNQEAIWQWQPVGTVGDTNEAYNYILIAVPNNVTISSFLLSSFESGDKRRTSWVKDTTINAVKYSYPFKYKIPNTVFSRAEYSTILRLGEQYLIRAEARAQQGKVTGANSAESDLNMLRTRAGLPNTTATTQAQMLDAILHERQVELFTEFGHRWLDLKRTGKLNSVMGAPGNVCQAKGGVWNPNWALYPIPNSEILLDNKLTQNPGY